MKYDNQTGYSLKQNLDFYETVDYQRETHTNNLGVLRFTDDIDGYKKKVFVIGDSHTQGVGVPSDCSFPFFLDLMLNMKDNGYKKDYLVLNLGVSGYGLQQSLIRLNKYVDIAGKPDYVIYVACSNDIDDDVLFKARRTSGPFLDGSYLPWIGVKFLQFVCFKSQIGKRLHEVYYNFWHKIVFTRDKPLEKADGKVLFCKLKEGGLSDLLDLQKQKKLNLLLSWIGGEYSQGSAYSSMREWAKDNSVYFADWRSSVESVVHNKARLPVSNNHSGSHHRSWVNYVLAKKFFYYFKSQE